MQLAGKSCAVRCKTVVGCRRSLAEWCRHRELRVIWCTPCAELQGCEVARGLLLMTVLSSSTEQLQSGCRAQCAVVAVAGQVLHQSGKSGIAALCYVAQCLQQRCSRLAEQEQLAA